MIGSWKIKVLSGVSILAIAGMSAAVLAAEQKKAQQAVAQEEILLGTLRITEETRIDETGTEETGTEEIKTEETQASKEETVNGKGKKTAERLAMLNLPVEIAEEDIDAYFDGTVFIGDSVMMGFRNYAMRRMNTYLGRVQFLASGSFSVHNAFWPVSAKSVHPIYQGAQRPVWDSLGMIQPKRVFLFFGLNDMNMGTLDETCDLYSQVIANIKLTCPDTEIHLMSMTYTLRGAGRRNLTNPNIRIFNEMLKQMARDNGWGFVDIANPLADANGDLAPVYCSDNYVHQTNTAYDVWSAVLRDYACSQLDGSSEFFIGERPLVEFEAAGYGEIRLDDEEETDPSEREELFGTAINP